MIFGIRLKGPRHPILEKKHREVNLKGIIGQKFKVNECSPEIQERKEKLKEGVKEFKQKNSEKKKKIDKFFEIWSRKNSNSLYLIKLVDK